jgi:hypothetical protein
MRTGVVALLLFGTLLCMGQSKRGPDPNNATGPYITVDEIKAERTPGRRIYLDGSVSNSGGGRVKGHLVLCFDLQDSDGRTISTRKGPATESDFAPGDTTEFHFELPDSARAVQFVVRAQDKSNSEINVGKGGPYWIE